LKQKAKATASGFYFVPRAFYDGVGAEKIEKTASFVK
jgi:hypothetical protein